MAPLYGVDLVECSRLTLRSQRICSRAEGLLALSEVEQAEKTELGKTGGWRRRGHGYGGRGD